MRNGIILFDYADKLRKNEKMTVKEAALEAGKRRMRPIVLTSVAASSWCNYDVGCWKPSLGTNGSYHLFRSTILHGLYINNPACFLLARLQKTGY